MSPLRSLSRLLAVLLLVALALAGLAAAVFCVSGGSSGVSIPGLAKILHLSGLRSDVGQLLSSVEGGGSVKFLPLLGGLAAVVIGVLLLLGTFARYRERLVVVDRGSEGTLASRKRPLRQLAAWLAESGRGVSHTKVRVRSTRRGKGKLKVTAYRPRSATDADVAGAVQESLAPLAEGFRLRERVRVVEAEGRERVE